MVWWRLCNRASAGHIDGDIEGDIDGEIDGDIDGDIDGAADSLAGRRAERNEFMGSGSIDFRVFGDELLTNLLDFAAHAIPGALGAGLSVAVDMSNDSRCLVASEPALDSAPPGGTPRTVAAIGVAAVLDPAQWEQAAGPLWEAFRSGRLVQVPEPGETATQPAGLDLGTMDGATELTTPGVPDLGLSSLSGIDPEIFHSVRGAVFSAGEWGGELPVVLSFYFDRPADAKILRDIDKYEPVVSQALSVVEYCAGEKQVAQQMLHMTQYRRVIEQAKGLVMGASGGDASSAFATLARASQHFNIRLRHLAVALVEHVGGGAAEHPDDPDLVIRPSADERQVAARVWAALTTAAILPPASAGPG